MLIRKNDIPEIKIPVGEKAFGNKPIRAKGDARFVLCQKGDSVAEKIGEVEENEVIVIPTRSNWGTTHLIEHLLQQTGPANCWLTSWSVKEQAVRSLLDLCDRGMITELHCLFDERTQIQCPRAYQLAFSQVANIRLTKIHAKVAVIQNKDWGISIVTSANLTRNPRIECYVILTHAIIANYQLEWIQGVIEDSNPFKL